MSGPYKLYQRPISVMPEEAVFGTDVHTALDCLEHYSLENHLSRKQNYTVIHTALETGGNLSLEETKRLLAICVHDMREDMMFTATVLNIIQKIISRVKEGKYDPCPDLVPSALAVIHLIKTTALLSKVESLKVLCYDILLSYPDDTLIEVSEHHEELLEIYNLYCHMRIPNKACNLLYKLLLILPPEKKKEFVEKGVSVWFSKIIPLIVNHVTVIETDSDTAMEILEMLTDELVTCDYSNNPQWDLILECICDTQKYPLIMKNLLQNGRDIWHRLWIVFIRLLKHQVTQALWTIGTPINSMLPVVEAAFKVDVDNRCKAFMCWNVLIDSFSTETNESNINKRIKLLIIPLKSNNAKVEATALAKFKCWWHLLQKFQNKIEKFLDIVLVSFLYFCFGRHTASDKSVLVPGQISVAMKKLCIQAIVDLVGHVNCYGCTELPKLQGKMITTKHLVDNWNHWIFSINSAIKMSANTDYGLTKQQMTCLWKSFLMTIGELPENNIRKDLVSEMLSILGHLVQECKSNSKMADYVFHALILSFFDKDIRIKQLVRTKNDVNDPIFRIVMIVLDPSLDVAFQGYTTSTLVPKLRPITDMIIDPVFSTPNAVVNCLLKAFPESDTALALWTALLESVCETKYDLCPQILCNLMMWPLRSINTFSDIKHSAMTWYTTYNLIYPKLKKTELYKDIPKFLLHKKDMTNSIKFFRISIILGWLNNELKENKFDIDGEYFKVLTSNIDSYQHLKQLFPILMDTVLALINIGIYKTETLTWFTLKCVKKILIVLTQACVQESDISEILSLVESLLKALDPLLKMESCSKNIPMMVDDLIDCYSFFSKQTLTKSMILCLMKTFSANIAETDINYTKIIAIINKINNETNIVENNQSSDNNKFTTPKIKEVPKKSKNKETSIVNTVVENGEEYVVVKSNWKFNPRKLTENQKEKLQRKREDIPALYQDLSQSQDDLKLVSWKTDSQDTSNSSKSESKSFKSGSNDTTTQFLKNLPSSNVVPKILESFFSENEKKECNAKDLLISKDIAKKKEDTTSKNTKSPRMALKDRVFRNVRNLIEKSGVQKENKDSAEDLNKTESLIKTPTQSKSIDSANIVNSAPPLLSADRPSRVKRKPKKFDEQLLLSVKKRRQSLQDLKSVDKSKKSDIVKSVPDTNKVIHSMEEDGAPIDTVSLSNETNIQDDIQLPENQNSHSVNENEVVLNKNEQEKEENVTDKINEEKNIEVESKEKQNTSVDVDTSDNNKKCSDLDVQPNTMKDENANEKRDKISNDKKDEICNNMRDEKSNDKRRKKSSENITGAGITDVKEVSTPKPSSKNKEAEEQKSTTKKNSVKQSRIEKELAIDMVEGHPFLKINQKRVTRKALESAGTGRRKSLAEKLNKSKSEPNSTVKKPKEKNRESDSSNVSYTIDESQDKDSETKDQTSFSEDLPYSDDVIESSQDSSITTISVKSAKKSSKKVPIVSLQKLKFKADNINESQSILECVPVDVSKSPSEANHESKDDIELPLNKTALDEKSEADLTENMDTEPIEDKEYSEVIVIVDDVPAPLTISSDDTEVGPETQEIAEADTQPTNPKDYMDIDMIHEDATKSLTVVEIGSIGIDTCSISNKVDPTRDQSVSDTPINSTGNNTTITLSDSAYADLEKKSGGSSPSSFGDEAQRKQDFLNNTLEISPIKNMSPDRNKNSPSPNTSGEYVVIQLSSPVQSNGEPFEKCGSPEVFTEEKVSPDKRDQSPPRVEVTVINTSPSSSLSLKKNRPQMRSGGRAAQMLGLCAPDKLQAIINLEKAEIEEVKKCSTSSTPARRNLRILYNSVSDTTETTSENDDSETFLKFRRSLPTVDSSPSGPILKRKLIEITDEATMSPASKRKRVSFHDPPVSTTISVQKYIEPGILRSPQNSAQKRLERQMRQHTPIKSPKRLDHAFKLDTMLTKTIESFDETEVITTPDDTQQFSLDETPEVEIVRASELNDTDPICPDLLDCKDPIDNIASELSSPAMKSLLIKELAGKIGTVGDLAKMTELEVNRLCIKAPKIKVAKKVLTDYAAKRVEKQCDVIQIEPFGELANLTALGLNRVCNKAPNVKVVQKVFDNTSMTVEKPSCDVMVTIDDTLFDEPMIEPELKGINMEIQTETNASIEMEVQTDSTPTTVTFVQTETMPTAHMSIQTDESGSKSTADIIKSCLAERPDFVEEVKEHLEESSIQHIADKLPFRAMMEMLMKKVTPNKSRKLLTTILDHQCNNSSESNQISKGLHFIREYVCNRYDSKDLILFCSEVLKAVYDKPTEP